MEERRDKLSCGCVVAVPVVKAVGPISVGLFTSGEQIATDDFDGASAVGRPYCNLKPAPRAASKSGGVHIVGQTKASLKPVREIGFCCIRYDKCIRP